jgi:hypothetical protein
VVAGHDDVIGAQARRLDMGEHVGQQLPRRDAEQPLVGVRERVQVAQLQDLRRRHRLDGRSGRVAGIGCSLQRESVAGA